MMKYLKKLLILLVAIISLSVAFASGDVIQGTVRIVDWTRYVNTSENPELTVVFVPELPSGVSALNTVEATAEILIKKEDGTIVFHEIFEGIQYGSQNEIRIDVCEFAENCKVDDGKYILNLIVHGIAIVNNTLVGVELVDKPVSFYINTYYSEDVDIVKVEPDFNVMKVIPPVSRKVYVKVKNDGERGKIVVKAEVCDKYGNKVLSSESSRVLSTGEEYTFTVTVDFSKLEEGREYTLYIRAFPEDNEKVSDSLKYLIYVSDVDYNPIGISLTKVFFDPLVVKPGSYVKLTLVFRNLANEKKIASVILWNDKYEIYRNLGEIEFEKGLTKVPVVIKVPEKVTDELLLFKVSIRQEDKEIVRDVFVPVKIEKKSQIVRVKTEVKKNKLEVTLTNLIEEIVDYKLVVDSNVTITPKEVEVRLGGKGDEKTITFELEGPAGEHKIYLRVYKDGETVVEKELKVRIEKRRVFPYDYLVYAVVGVVVFVLAFFGYKLWKEREERPSYE